MKTSELFSNNQSSSSRWLIHIISSDDSLGDSHQFVDIQHGNSFIEMDPDSISKRWVFDSDDTGFDLSITQSLLPSQISFTGPLQLPLRVTSSPPKRETYFAPDLDRSKSINSSRSLLSKHNHYHSRSSSFNSSTVFHSSATTSKTVIVTSRSAKLKSPTIRHSAKFLRKIFWRYLWFLIPLYEKVKGARLHFPKSGKSSTSSAGTSHMRVNNSCSSMEWCRSNADILIHDAILHCKRSIGQDMLSRTKEEHGSRDIGKDQ